MNQDQRIAVEALVNIALHGDKGNPAGLRARVLQALEAACPAQPQYDFRAEVPQDPALRLGAAKGQAARPPIQPPAAAPTQHPLLLRCIEALNTAQTASEYGVDHPTFKLWSQLEDDLHAALASPAAAPCPRGHSWNDFGQLGGRNVSWCPRCDTLAFTGNEPAPAAAPTHSLDAIETLANARDVLREAEQRHAAMGETLAAMREVLR